MALASQFNGYEGIMLPAVVATIANGAQESSAINLNGMSLCGIFLPAAFTGTALTFEASADGVTFVVVKSTTSGTSLSYTVAQGTYVAIDPKDFQGIACLKIKSGTTETGARTLYCALKGIV